MSRKVLTRYVTYIIIALSNKEGDKQMAKKSKNKRLSHKEIAELIIKAVLALAALITAITA